MLEFLSRINEQIDVHVNTYINEEVEEVKKREIILEIDLIN